MNNKDDSQARAAVILHPSFEHILDAVGCVLAGSTSYVVSTAGFADWQVQNFERQLKELLPSYLPEDSLFATNSVTVSRPDPDAHDEQAQQSLHLSV